jgi:hypothetical protein
VHAHVCQYFNLADGAVSPVIDYTLVDYCTELRCFIRGIWHAILHVCFSSAAVHIINIMYIFCGQSPSPPHCNNHWIIYRPMFALQCSFMYVICVNYTYYIHEWTALKMLCLRPHVFYLLVYRTTDLLLGISLKKSEIFLNYFLS